MISLLKKRKAALTGKIRRLGSLRINLASRFPTPVQTGSGSKGLIPLNHLSSDELPQGLTLGVP
jgi:hypothetical protein